MPAYLPVPVQIKMIEAQDRLDPSQLPVNTDDWRESSACREVDPDLFFPLPNDYMTAESAVMFCGRCPVRRPCRELRDSIGAEGVWGGVFYPTRTGPTVRERECTCGCGMQAQRGKQYHSAYCRHVELVGSVEGFRLHRRLRQAPCTPCAEAEAQRLAEKAAWRRIAHRKSSDHERRTSVA